MKFPIESKFCPMCGKLGYKRTLYTIQKRCNDCKISFGPIIYIYLDGFENKYTHKIYGSGELYKHSSWHMSVNIKYYNSIKEALNAFIKLEVFS